MTLRYLGQGRITYQGEQSYDWSGHGAEQDVTVADASVLLLMTRKEGPCCGGPKHDAGPLFEEVDDNTVQIPDTEE